MGPMKGQTNQRNSRTSLNPFVKYRTSASYLKREAERRYDDVLLNEPPRNTRSRHSPLSQTARPKIEHWHSGGKPADCSKTRPPPHRVPNIPWTTEESDFGKTTKLTLTGFPACQHSGFCGTCRE